MAGRSMPWHDCPAPACTEQCPWRSNHGQEARHLAHHLNVYDSCITGGDRRCRLTDSNGRILHQTVQLTLVAHSPCTKPATLEWLVQNQRPQSVFHDVKHYRQEALDSAHWRMFCALQLVSMLSQHQQKEC